MNTEILKELARARAKLETERFLMNKMLADVKERAIYVEAEQFAAEAQDEITRLTELVKDEAKKEYAITGMKQLPGVTIKIMTRYCCTDEEAARKWVMETAPIFALIDWKGLQQEAKKLHGSTFALPFYREEHDVAPQIKPDLSEFLATREG